MITSKVCLLQKPKIRFQRHWSVGLYASRRIDPLPLSNDKSRSSEGKKNHAESSWKLPISIMCKSNFFAMADDQCIMQRARSIGHVSLSHLHCVDLERGLSSNVARQRMSPLTGIDERNTRRLFWNIIHFSIELLRDHHFHFRDVSTWRVCGTCRSAVLTDFILPSSAALLQHVLKDAM